MARQFPERRHGGIPGRNGVAVRAAVFAFGMADGAQTDLQQRTPQLVDAPQHAGVRNPATLVRFAQIGMGVEVHDADLHAGGPEGADGAQRGRVFAAQDDRDRAGLQRPGHGLFNAAQPALA